MNFFENFIELLGPYLPGLLIATSLGFLLGLEREFNKGNTEDAFAGIRTFPIVAIAGYMIGYLNQEFNHLLVIVSIPSILLFIAITYFAKTRSEILGLTTAISLFTVFLLGIFSSYGYYRESLATAVVIVTLLALKGKLHGMMKKITQDEMYAVIRFVIIALLIIPFLPREDFGPNGILNPFEIGIVVLIVIAFSFVGYFLIKFIGPGKGILFIAIVGGFFSSTAVAWNFSADSKRSPELSHQYAAGIIFASSIMYLRLFLLSIIINPEMLSVMWLPFLSLFVICIIPGLIALRKRNTQVTGELNLGNPLNILNALGFALLLIAIIFTVYYAKMYLGTTGLILTGIFAGIADTDAITISMSGYSTGAETVLASMVILIATMSNLTVKTMITVFRSSKETSKYMLISFGLTITSSLLYLFIRFFIMD